MAGAADMFLATFLCLLGNALFAYLRARSAAPEVMAVGLSLLGLAFSHPMGAAVAFAVVPGLVFAVRPMLVANSAINLVVALIFPTVFALGAFAYVSWVFPGDGWSFLAAPTESLAGWAADATRIFPAVTGSLTINAAFAVAAALALGAPVAPVVIRWIRERRPLVLPPLVLAGAVIAAAGDHGRDRRRSAARRRWSPRRRSSPRSSSLMCRLPDASGRRMALALLAAGWFGGASPSPLPRRASPCSFAFRPPTAAAAEQARAHRCAQSRRHVTLHRQRRRAADRHFDNAPAVVLGRGAAAWTRRRRPIRKAFALTLLFGRLNSPFVAVPDPHASAGIRRSGSTKAFPMLLSRRRAGIPARLSEQDVAALRPPALNNGGSDANSHRRRFGRLA